MEPIVIRSIVLFCLLLLSAFFSSAETAMSAVNRVQMRALAEEGDKRAASVLRIADDYQKMLSAILIGNNIVNLTASALATVIVTDAFGSVWIGLGTGILTFLVLLFGEIIPKTAAKAHADKIARLYAPLIRFFMMLLTPLIVIINAIATGVLKLFRVDLKERASMTENELKTYVDVSHEDGVIETEEKEMIYNVFDFGDALAKDIMIPRIDMSCVNVDASLADVIRVFREDMYTRLPVYEKTPDHIIGLLNIKDLAFIDDKNPFHVRDYMREGYYTYEFKKTSGLLMEMREQARNIAFVLDEYGATVGMITLEDLLEEIVGEIRDEYDSDEEELLKDLGEGRYLIEAVMKLDDINDALHTELESEDYDSIGGLMIGALDRIPHNRESVTLADGTVLTARGIKQNRILKVLMTLPEKQEDNQSDPLKEEPASQGD
ncbi:MAG: HlyC/CorC family transporter [Lachnospiraceae bacterium]|nr:HlyC/CorC family transporter [Lachnospiraceae bacterium]